MKLFSTKAFFLFCCPIVFLYVSFVSTRVASDENMIRHFKQHRAEIEELIKRYREFDVPSNNDTFDYSHDAWIAQHNNTVELLNKAGIDKRGIYPKGDSNFGYTPTLWLPNPYTIETANAVNRIYKNGIAETRRASYRYGMLVVELLPRNKYENSAFFSHTIRKNLYYIPEIPRIENNELLGAYGIDGNYSFRRKIVSSLNYQPISWHINKFIDSNCVLRQIEAQWFLRMCNPL